MAFSASVASAEEDVVIAVTGTPVYQYNHGKAVVEGFLHEISRQREHLTELADLLPTRDAFGWECFVVRSLAPTHTA